jgi:hypothetical protein
VAEIFGDMTACYCVSSYRYFKGYRCANISFFELPYPEDEGTVILRNAGYVSPHNTALYPSNCSFGNLKSGLKELVVWSLKLPCLKLALIDKFLFR